VGVNTIDVMHLGRTRVIAAYEIGDLLIDPGPASCLETLLSELTSEPRAILLTHIHLDHAGATGLLVRRFPKLRVYVHEVGAPHVVDPSRLLASATRLYGEDGMERLWGEVAPVPERNVVPLRGGEEVEGFRVAATPGHAPHHVCYLDTRSGGAYVGDVAGVRIPPVELTWMPTPPPDIDVEAWMASLEAVGEWSPEQLFLTHFGSVGDVPGQLQRAREALARQAELARNGDRGRFISTLAAEVEGLVGGEHAERFRQAAPPEQLWLGLERYWRKRNEAARS
jgi:glyoxylase-like metal-dependent hydrolase (beta-lactamase superfamily II)